jgi:hypothetical protein
VRRFVPLVLPCALGCAAAPAATPTEPPAPLAVRSPEPPVAPTPEPAAATAQPQAPAATPERAPDATPTGAEPAPIPPKTTVLHIGDSFVFAGFAQALKPRMQALGVRYTIRSEQSSYTVTWAARIEQALLDTKPDLVIINLGANEVANVDPPAHAPAVRRIVKLVGDRPCVWVSPPMWRKDTGILDVIRENSAPCRFFDSDLLVTEPIPRQPDKIHPNAEGGEIWASAFWKWLHGERTGAGPSPWALRPSPPEEHMTRAALAAQKP